MASWWDTVASCEDLPIRPDLEDLLDSDPFSWTNHNRNR